jgi:hypothetical protein
MCYYSHRQREGKGGEGEPPHDCNIVARLTGKELEVLLRWKGVPVSKMGNVANRWVLYQQFADGGEEEEDNVSIPTPWTDADETGLVTLRNAPIEISWLSRC